jgi:hypothetical protein
VEDRECGRGIRRWLRRRVDLVCYWWWWDVMVDRAGLKSRTNQVSRGGEFERTLEMK